MSNNLKALISLTTMPLATLWLVTFVQILSISEKEWLLIRVGISTSGYKLIECIVSTNDSIPRFTLCFQNIDVKLVTEKNCFTHR